MVLSSHVNDGRYKHHSRTFVKSKPPKLDLTGQHFSKLGVIEWAGTWNQKNFWVCQCECGDPEYNPVVVFAGSLTSGNTTSCGCTTRRHKMSGTKIYHIWCNMIRRCTDPSKKEYRNYGGRGITVCERWLKFENFYADMGERPDGCTLDRVENNLGYSPENCAWRTYKDQANNTRTNHFITWQGETKTTAQWAEDERLVALGVQAGYLRSRLKAGWSIEEAMTTPAEVGDMITYNGITLNMMDWSRRLGTDRTNVVSKRIRRGWSIEKAVTTPLNPIIKPK
jgi:hypothetical protein